MKANVPNVKQLHEVISNTLRHRCVGVILMNKSQDPNKYTCRIFLVSAAMKTEPGRES